MLANGSPHFKIHNSALSLRSNIQSTEQGKFVSKKRIKINLLKRDKQLS